MEAKVRDYPDLIKRNGGVINTNSSDYARAKSRVNQQKRISNLESNFDSMSKTMNEILGLLKQLTDK